MVAVPLGASFFANQNPPHYITNAFYCPPGYTNNGAVAITTTTNRCYYVPLAIWEPHTFQGVVTLNAGAADNGKKIRIMVFSEATAGGPGTLSKDFGEITLTGASALRTLSSSWTAAPGMYWFAFWCDSAASMVGMTPYWSNTAVGGGSGFSIHHGIGDLVSAGTSFGTGTTAACHYVDTAYGAAPATAVAPTSSLLTAWGSTTPQTPDFRLKG